MAARWSFDRHQHQHQHQYQYQQPGGLAAFAWDRLDTGEEIAAGAASAERGYDVDREYYGEEEYGEEEEDRNSTGGSSRSSSPSNNSSGNSEGGVLFHLDRERSEDYQQQQQQRRYSNPWLSGGAGGAGNSGGGAEGGTGYRAGPANGAGRNSGANNHHSSSSSSGAAAATAGHSQHQHQHQHQHHRIQGFVPGGVVESLINSKINSDGFFTHQPSSTSGFSSLSPPVSEPSEGVVGKKLSFKPPHPHRIPTPPIVSALTPPSSPPRPPLRNRPLTPPLTPPNWAVSTQPPGILASAISAHLKERLAAAAAASAAAAAAEGNGSDTVRLAMGSQYGYRDDDRHPAEDEPSGGTLVGAISSVTGRDIQAFGRTVTATAGSLINPFSEGSHPTYSNAMTTITEELRKPTIQQRVFALNARTPSELVRSKLSTAEIQYRAVTYLPDEILKDIPDHSNTYSLFQGFQASLPENPKQKKKKAGKHRALPDQHGSSSEMDEPVSLGGLEQERADLTKHLEMLGIRKNMCSSEIRDIDMKIANLNIMRQIVLQRLANLEQEEAQTEHEIIEVDNKIEDLRYDIEEGRLQPEGDAMSDMTPPTSSHGSSSFMSESIYQKIPKGGSRKHRKIRKISMPILHEHFEPGTSIKEMQCHSDTITALDFDVPFGTMVTAALDDTVRVWDLSNGRCMGMLEGHHASVRCIQVEDNFVATGSMDATIRVWDLGRAEHYRTNDNSDDEDENAPTEHINLTDCAVYTLDSHVDAITALHFHGETLVSGSSDKTLRQWDLSTGRCVQTLDVLWAAAQNSMVPSDESRWKLSGRKTDASADFIGAVQVFDAALACGTADGMVRLWDLRSGQVHRSLVGHTGPVTCLQFDDVHLVTGSLDRSIRIWDLRTGSIFDVYGYENPVTDMQFDARRIVSAAGEKVVKVYDKTDGRHWDCGRGVEEGVNAAIVERVKIKDGYLVEGRRDGIVGVWAC